jgi:hypothetical protein
MPNLKLRPQLKSFRALAFHAENRDEANGQELQFELKQDVELSLGVPTVQGASLQVAVRIRLNAIATNKVVTKETAGADVPHLSGEYEAKFYYPAEANEDAVGVLLVDEEYQYLLVSQAFPLAMSHFRREMQALGLDSRELPLGLA